MKCPFVILRFISSHFTCSLLSLKFLLKLLPQNAFLSKASATPFSSRFFRQVRRMTFITRFYCLRLQSRLRFRKDNITSFGTHRNNTREYVKSTYYLISMHHKSFGLRFLPHLCLSYDNSSRYARSGSFLRK